MIDAYVAKGPNPQKLIIFLEETQLSHRKHWLDLTCGDHRTPEFLAISPSAKVPAIVDRWPAGGGAPVTIFESAAILIYLAEKSGKFLPSAPRERAEVLTWLIWQVAALGPTSGQAGHFLRYAPRGNAYAEQRYVQETCRLYQVLDERLIGRDFIAGEYSIADMACHPWVEMHAMAGIELREYPNIAKWLATVAHRPAVQAARACAAAAPLRVGTPEQFRRNLFHDHCDPEIAPLEHGPI